MIKLSCNVISVYTIVASFAFIISIICLLASTCWPYACHSNFKDSLVCLNTADASIALLVCDVRSSSVIILFQ